MPSNIIATQLPQMPSQPRINFRRFAIAAFALFVVNCGSAPAQSDLKITCRQQDKPADAAGMVLTYAGAEKGTLKVTCVLGEMELPARRTDKKTKVQGADYAVTGVEAWGPANIPMPGKAGLETCLKNKKADPKDADLIAFHLNLCKQEVPVAKDPVAVDVSVVVTIIDESNPEVYVTRTFKEESAVAGGRMKLDIFPHEWVCKTGEAKP